MAGRGRGRGRGISFNVEALGFGRGEALPGSTQQPPPLFPPVNFKAVPLATGEGWDYMLALKQEFRGAIRKSPYFLDSMEKKKDIERYSDKYQLGQQDNGSGWTPDWRRLPAELKLRSKKPRKIKTNIKPNLTKARALITDTDVVKKLESLEKVPDEGEVTEEKEKEKKGEGEEEDEEEVEDFYEDEELEEETDYNLNYFDNGEGYGDDDDDVDEGPVY